MILVPMSEPFVRLKRLDPLSLKCYTDCANRSLQVDVAKDAELDGLSLKCRLPISGLVRKRKGSGRRRKRRKLVRSFKMPLKTRLVPSVTPGSSKNVSSSGSGEAEGHSRIQHSVAPSVGDGSIQDCSALPTSYSEVLLFSSLCTLEEPSSRNSFKIFSPQDDCHTSNAHRVQAAPRGSAESEDTSKKSRETVRETLTDPPASCELPTQTNQLAPNDYRQLEGITTEDFMALLCLSPACVAAKLRNCTKHRASKYFYMKSRRLWEKICREVSDRYPDSDIEFVKMPYVSVKRRNFIDRLAAHPVPQSISLKSVKGYSETAVISKVLNVVLKREPSLDLLAAQTSSTSSPSLLAAPHEHPRRRRKRWKLAENFKPEVHLQDTKVCTQISPEDSRPVSKVTLAEAHNGTNVDLGDGRIDFSLKPSNLQCPVVKITRDSGLDTLARQIPCEIASNVCSRDISCEKPWIKNLSTKIAMSSTELLILRDSFTSATCSSGFTSGSVPHPQLKLELHSGFNTSVTSTEMLGESSSPLETNISHDSKRVLASKSSAQRGLENLSIKITRDSCIGQLAVQTCDAPGANISGFNNTVTPSLQQTSEPPSVPGTQAIPTEGRSTSSEALVETDKNLLPIVTAGNDLSLRTIPIILRRTCGDWSVVQPPAETTRCANDGAVQPLAAAYNPTSTPADSINAPQKTSVCISRIPLPPVKSRSSESDQLNNSQDIHQSLPRLRQKRFFHPSTMSSVRRSPRSLQSRSKPAFKEESPRALLHNENENPVCHAIPPVKTVDVSRKCPLSDLVVEPRVLRKRKKTGLQKSSPKGISEGDDVSFGPPKPSVSSYMCVKSPRL